MLRVLRISNFALISQLELTWEQGFTVITGETGSGKSILLNALQLILGERADFSVIGPLSNKAIVEAIFEDGESHKDFLTAHDLDVESQLLIRREIHKDGKSRAFINDSPVSLSVLRSCTSNLVQIHSQYNTLELKSPEYQLSVVDTLADLNDLKIEFSTAFKSWNQLKKELAAKREILDKQLATQDYNRFVLEELETLELDKVNYANLEALLLRAEQAGQLKGLFSELSALSGSSFLDNFYVLRSKLDKLKAGDEQLEQFSERLNGLLVEWKELSQDASNFLHNLENEEINVFEITEKIDKFNRILSKHRVNHQDELQLLKNKLLEETHSVEELEQEIEKMSLQVSNQANILLKKALQLHESRMNATPHIQQQLHALLSDLKLPHTTIDIVFEKLEELNTNGCSKIQFLFSANLGMTPVPIEKAASGGELSRFMLALQKLISEKKSLPTVLFDEIDTGVSGDVAQKMGALLRKMGNSRQLIAISHLPQVVAQASSHFFVAKNIVEDRMSTTVTSLPKAQRVQEVARLLSGDQITEAAMETAKHLMEI